MYDLAINGGTPIRQASLSYGKQYVDEADIQAVTNALRQSFITGGPKVVELEEKLCQVTEAQYAVAVSSGTAALHIACLAIGLKEGDEVITTPMTFAASANCVRYCGASVVFADINPDTYNIDPVEIEAKITSRTKAVIVVDFTGQAAELEQIKNICKRHHIILIEDAAHAIGTRYQGKAIGSIADVTCFSFHPVKTVTAGEGGAVTTNDSLLDQRLRLFRSHGITHDDALMVNESIGAWYYEQLELGFNYRMTDFQAALLLSQLDKLPRFKARRRELAAYYDESFKNIKELVLQKHIDVSETTPHLYVIQLNLERLNCSRKMFFEALWAEGIHCQVHYIPVYYHPYYQALGYSKGLCPQAERLYERIMSIPLYYSLTDEEAADVVLAVKKVITYYRKKDKTGGEAI